MAHRDDAAIQRARVGKTMIVAHPDQNLAPAEIRQACNRSFGPPVYLRDVAILASVAFAFGLLGFAVENDIVKGLFAVATISVLPGLFFVPLVRRIESKDVLSRLDLDTALEVDLPNAEIEAEAYRFTRQWGRESRARAEHLQAAWSLASSGWLHESSGRRMRHSHGPCPGCKAGDKQWCDDSCPLLDPVDHR